MPRHGTVALLAGALCLMWGLAALQSASPVAAQGLPPRPTIAPPRSADDDDDSEAAPGRIAGTVIDLTTGAPAPGVSVDVGGRAATTDANGNYDLNGLPPGAYQIALVLAPGAGEPAQAAVAVTLPEGGTVIQHLSFRSPPAVSAEPPPRATVPEVVPAALPRSAGGDPAALPLAAGLALLAAGAYARRRA